METLLADQKKNAEDMAAILSNYKKDSPDRKTIPYIKERIDRANVVWQRLTKTNDKLEPTRDNSLPYFKNDTFIETQRVFMEVSTILTQKLWLLETEEKKKNKNDEDEDPRNKNLEQNDEYERMLSTTTITEIHLTDLFEDIENMDLTTKSLGTLELTTEELKGQFNEWKKGFIDIQRYEKEGYNRRTYDTHHKRYVNLCVKIQDAMIAARNAIAIPTSNIKTTADLPKIKIPDFDGNVTA